MSTTRRYQRPLGSNAPAISDLAWHLGQVQQVEQRLASAHLSPDGRAAWEKSLEHHLGCIRQIREQQEPPATAPAMNAQQALVSIAERQLQQEAANG